MTRIQVACVLALSRAFGSLFSTGIVGKAIPNRCIRIDAGKVFDVAFTSRSSEVAVTKFFCLRMSRELWLRFSSGLCLASGGSAVLLPPRITMELISASLSYPKALPQCCEFDGSPIAADHSRDIRALDERTVEVRSANAVGHEANDTELDDRKTE